MKVKVFDSMFDQRELFENNSGFPPLENTPPPDSRIQVKTGLLPTPTIASGRMVSMNHDNGFATILLDKNTRPTLVHHRNLRPELGPDGETFTQPRIAQWCYRPDRFAAFIKQIENSIGIGI